MSDAEKFQGFEVPAVADVSRVPRNALVGLEVQFIPYDIDGQPLDPRAGVVTGISRGGPTGIIITTLHEEEGERYFGYLGGTQSPSDIVEIAPERWSVDRMCNAVRKSLEKSEFTPDQIDKLVIAKREILTPLMQGELK